MVTLLIGKKGSGKTKKLIELANQAVKESQGNVVVIEKGKKLTYDLTYEARLVDVEAYSVKGYDMLFGFISGICAGNYDVTDVLVAATFKIVGREFEKLPQFFDMLSNLSEASDVDFYFTISCDKEDLPVEIFDYCEEEPHN